MPSRSSFEATPLVIDGILYVPSPLSRLFALDAETGKQSDLGFAARENQGGAAWSTSGLFFGFFLCTLAFTQEKAPGRPKEKLPQSVAPQPVAFSHKVHARKVGLPCNFCHVELPRAMMRLSRLSTSA
jgi:hypothetical protein